MESDWSNEVSWKPAVRLLPPSLKALSTNGVAQVAINGEVYATYLVESSLDLTAWVPLNKVVTDERGRGLTSDYWLGFVPSQFYRVIQ